MTPKEKAIDIYSKMFNKIYNSHLTDFVVTQCALIAVNEIIDEIIEIDSQMSETHLLDKNLKYWIEVKKEIENL
jgi:hypothetical protein